MDASIDRAPGAEKTPQLPPFMHRGPNCLELWAPPLRWGDFDIDFQIGQLYAEMAVRYAREIENPAMLAAVMSAIQVKAARREIVMDGIEAGFIDRVCKLAYVGSYN